MSLVGVSILVEDFVHLVGLMVRNRWELHVQLDGFFLPEGVDYHAARVVILQGHDDAVQMQRQQRCYQQPNHIYIWIAAEHVGGCLYWQSVNHVWEVSSSRKRYLLRGEPITPVGDRLSASTSCARRSLVRVSWLIRSFKFSLERLKHVVYLSSSIRSRLFVASSACTFFSISSSFRVISSLSW